MGEYFTAQKLKDLSAKYGLQVKRKSEGEKGKKNVTKKPKRK